MTCSSVIMSSLLALVRWRALSRRRPRMLSSGDIIYYIPSNNVLMGSGEQHGDLRLGHRHSCHSLQNVGHRHSCHSLWNVLTTPYKEVLGPVIKEAAAGPQRQTVHHTAQRAITQGTARLSSGRAAAQPPLTSTFTVQLMRFSLFSSCMMVL